MPVHRAQDWPGFGRSDPPASLPTYDAEVERIDRLADSFGLDRFNLIAHDYGGFLGLGYVLRHPGRVARLALLNTRAHNIFRPWFYRFSQGQRWAAVHAPAILRGLPLRRLHHLALRPYRALGCFDDELENEYLGWMDTAAGRRTFVDRDRYIPFATASELARQIPGATLTRLTGGDHYIMEERPDEVTAALLNLLARPCIVGRQAGIPPG
ncbi:MAG TPA: alpha/beta hydrolase [Mycobacterium sp.]|nr:alpha/beta hydrolase [Mycobacterium sp.]